ncbi:hypothetical protein J4Q44_G00369450 [Coregonus suidteri]|uniref:Uncharacterized protein n=1 Tax=Coregonus suidteri TaxID=861788 RepID=A0AAN8KTN9_9TELE
MDEFATPHLNFTTISVGLFSHIGCCLSLSYIECDRLGNIAQGNTVTDSPLISQIARLLYLPLNTHSSLPPSISLSISPSLHFSLHLSLPPSLSPSLPPHSRSHHFKSSTQRCHV